RVHGCCEGWYGADGARMGRALHPELVKRSPARDLGAILTKDQMLKFTAEGAGREVAADRRLEIDVADVCGDIASVVVRSAPYREYLHLVRTGGGGQLADGLGVPQGGRRRR